MNKILLFSEQQCNITELAQMLKSPSLQTFSCNSSSSFMQIVRQQDIDLIFLDVTTSDCFELNYIKKLQENPEISHIPVIVLSHSMDVNQKVKAFEKGAVDYISRPFDVLECTARMNVHLKKKRSEDVLIKYSNQLEQMVEARMIEIEETRKVTFFSLAKLAESRDPETGKHLERISHYSKILAGHLMTYELYRQEIDETFVENVFRCSPLHDIGKVGIPDNVLLKPGKLTPKEFESMKTHTVIGGQILEESEKHLNSSGFLRMGKDIAYFHHEKFDGTGYPYGLVGEEIPLSARIVSLADVYDALSSKRVYKAVFSHKKSKEVILEGKGSHFDPVIVDAFLACEEDFIYIKESFRDEWSEEEQDIV